MSKIFTTLIVNIPYLILKDKKLKKNVYWEYGSYKNYRISLCLTDMIRRVLVYSV